MNRIRLSTMALLSSALMLCAMACGDAGGEDAQNGDGGGGGGGGDTTKLQTGEGPCDSPSACEGEVCVALIDGNHPPEYCTQECGSCPSGFYCDSDTFALAGLTFCRFGDTTPSTPPPPPEEPPRLPCKSDAECGDGLVCATYNGERDCTPLCNSEDDCSISLGGVSLDLHTCSQDPTPDKDRQVCLPDPNCFPDATSCISLPF